MTVLAISNVATKRARRHAEAVRSALPQQEAHHYLTESVGEMEALIGHDRWNRDDLLVINGGDGTVQQALTILMHECPPDRWPRLACLPGGTTNMTAFDLNTHRRVGDCLVTLRRAIAGQVPASERSVVSVSSQGGSAARAHCGFFFGIGSIVQGIEYFHERLRHNGAAHELGAGAALVRTLWGMARRQTPFASPLQLRLEVPSPSSGERPRSFDCDGLVSIRLLLATTLERLLLGIRPYWGTGTGLLKSTLVETRAPAFISRVPRLLRGRPDRHMTPALGYHSARLESFTLGFRGSYTLDGELFTSSDDTIDVGATEAIRFLSL